MPLFECEYDENGQEKPPKVFALGVCSCIYHEECLQQWLKVQIENGQLPIKCPEPKCKKVLPIPDLRELLTEEERKRCYRFEWKMIRDQNPNMIECPTPDCEYMFMREDENQTYHQCEMCGVEYCLRCDMVYHVEKTCFEV